MSLWRDRALEKYDRLGMTLYPCFGNGMPWPGWRSPTPSMRETARECRVFGVLLAPRYVVIDVDEDNGGDLDALEAAYGPLPPTMTVTTKSGERNLHLYFRADNLRTCRKLTKRFPHIDFLADQVRGATSRWPVTPHREAAYIEQEPFLDPVPLPVALERDWRALQPSDDVFEYLELYGVARDLAPTAQGDVEQTYVRSRIATALELIESGSDGDRYDKVHHGSLSVFHWAVVLGEDPADYEDVIHTAYRVSGGRDWSKMRRDVRGNLTWVLQNPLPRPVVSSRVQVDPAIGEWADYVTSLITDPRATTQRALVIALAAEAHIQINEHDDGSDAIMTRSAEYLAGKYKVGDSKKVLKNLKKFRQWGFISKLGANKVKLETGQMTHIPRYALV